MTAQEQWREQRWDNSITNDYLFVVGYRIVVIGRVSWMIDFGSWYGCRNWMIDVLVVQYICLTGGVDLVASPYSESYMD